MKNLVMSFICILAVAGSAHAAEERYAHITSIKSNRMFPSQTVAITYERLCSERRVDIHKQSTFVNGAEMVGLGVLLKPTGYPCLTHEPAVITERVTIAIYAELPTKFYSLEEVGPGSMSGVSIGNFAN